MATVTHADSGALAARAAAERARMADHSAISARLAGRGIGMLRRWRCAPDLFRVKLMSGTLVMCLGLVKRKVCRCL